MRRGVWVVAVLTVVVTACSPSIDDLSGIRRTPLPTVSGTTLPDASDGGIDFDFQAASGDVLLVYFGYTACPDVCPTTLADLRVALEDLGSDAEKVEVAMVTVDPDRDTGEVLTRYVQSFVDGAHALRTDDPDRLAAAADAFGASYAVTTDDDGTVEVIHSAFVYAVDDQGRLQVTWPFGTTVDDIRSDLQILVASL